MSSSTLSKIINENRKYFESDPTNLSTLTCAEKMKRFSQSVNILRKVLIKDRASLLIGGIGEYENIKNDTGTGDKLSVIYKFFFDSNGEIKIVSIRNGVAQYIPYNSIDSEKKNAILIISAILQSKFVIDQVKQIKDPNAPESMSNPVLCFVNTISKNILNDHGFGNVFIGPADNLLELFSGLTITIGGIITGIAKIAHATAMRVYTDNTEIGSGVVEESSADAGEDVAVDAGGDVAVGFVGDVAVDVTADAAADVVASLLAF